MFFKGWHGNGLENEEDLDDGEQNVIEKVSVPPLDWLMQCFCKSASENQLLVRTPILLKDNV